jgi:hypothetical protein
MISIIDVTDAVSLLLRDEDLERWTKDEITLWCNMAQREICNLQPQACARTEVVQLAPGVRQQVPSGATLVVDIHRYMGTDGVTDGLAITKTIKGVMDRLVPDWPTAAPDPAPTHWMYDPERDPQVFYVYPPQPNAGCGYVEMTYAMPPEDASDANGLMLSIDKKYLPAVANYVLYRALSKDSEYGDYLNRAAMAYETFLGILGASSVHAAKTTVQRTPDEE